MLMYSNNVCDIQYMSNPYNKAHVFIMSEGGTLVKNAPNSPTGTLR